MSALLEQFQEQSLHEVWPIDRLAPNPLNPRGAIIEDDEIRGLAESIRLHGLLQPLVVTPEGVIVAGHRRFAACKLAGITSVSVMVRSFSEQEQAEVMLVENLQRRDLSPLQTAKGFKSLVDRGLSVETVAERVGWSKDTVRKHLTILDLAPQVQSMYDTRELSVGYITFLAEIESFERQSQVAQQAVDEGWLINEMARVVRIVAPQKRGRRVYRRKRTPEEEASVSNAQIARRAIHRLSKKCSDIAFNKRYYQSWIADLDDYMDDFKIEDKQIATIEAWHKGCRTNKDFAQFLGIALKDAEDLLEAMARDHVFCRVKQGGKQDVRRGARIEMWHLVEEPLGSDCSVVLDTVQDRLAAFNDDDSD